MSNTAYAYCRVSTDQQFESTLGIRAQVEQCLRYADYRGLDLGPDTQVDIDGHPFASRQRVVIEPASAYRKPFGERKGGGYLAGVLRPGHHIVVAKLDRGFRNTIDALTVTQGWAELGVVAHFLDMHVDTSTPSGKLLLTILAAVAEMESSRRSERTREANRQKKARNPASTLVLQPIEGFVFEGHGKERVLVYCPERRQVTRELYELYWGRCRRNREILTVESWKRRLKTAIGKDYNEYGVREAVNVEHGLREIELALRRDGQNPTPKEVAECWLAKFAGGTQWRSTLGLAVIPKAKLDVEAELQKSLISAGSE